MLLRGYLGKDRVRPAFVPTRTPNKNSWRVRLRVDPEDAGKWSNRLGGQTRCTKSEIAKYTTKVPACFLRTKNGKVA